MTMHDYTLGIDLVLNSCAIIAIAYVMIFSPRTGGADDFQQSCLLLPTEFHVLDHLDSPNVRMEGLEHVPPNAPVWAMHEA